LKTLDSAHLAVRLPRIPVRWGTPESGAVAQYRATGDLAAPVSIMIDPTRSRWQLAAVHEIGHFIDHCGIEPLHTLASVASDDLEPWRRALRRSYAFRILAERFGSPAYLSSVEECWARSYAQWIALATGDAVLNRQVVESRGKDPRLSTYFGQWDDEDFAEIAKEITRLFRSLGWLRETNAPWKLN
jgi:hypothetical protein